ncbi:hypothetical protein BCA37_21065 [Mycobacterium sp. djl-10]|nr:hypothetical protein BCA37_21065 [Mycobacterium sp. djl-10]
MGAHRPTFALRDNGTSFHADEDAIAALWKGSPLPGGDRHRRLSLFDNEADELMYLEKKARLSG